MAIRKLPRTVFKKNCIPWNKGLTKEKWLKHYKNGHPKGMLGKKQTQEWIENKRKEMIGNNFALGHTSWNKDKNIQTNSGKTHFKKGYIPWNKGKKFKERIRNEFRGYEWIKLRQLIRFRDNYKCRVCGIPEDGKAHCVHHIQPYNTLPNNQPENLITVCNPCHTNLHWHELGGLRK